MKRFRTVLFNYRYECILFIIGTIFTYPFLKPHFDFDSYCLLAKGYKEYSAIFFEAGRYVSGLFYLLFDLIHLPYSWLSVISVVLSNLFLAFAGAAYDKLIKSSTALHLRFPDLIFYVVALTLIFYNFLSLELFGFIESFVMCMGIYLIILSIRWFIKTDTYAIFISFLFLVVAISCYQGVMVLYLPLLAVIIVLRNRKYVFAHQWKIFLQAGCKALILYGGAFVFSYMSIQLYLLASHSESVKMGTINLLDNLLNISVLMYSTLSNLFSYFKPLIFYATTLILLFIISVTAIKNKRTFSLIFLFFIVLICVLIPFIPNIAMRSDSNYTAPRLTISIAAIVGICSIIAFAWYRIDKTKIKYLFYGILIIYCSQIFLTYNQTLHAANLKYYYDKESIQMIYDKIIEYETKSGQQIMNIYYAEDDFVSWFYSEVKPRNSFSYRLYACDWAMECAVNAFMDDRRFHYAELSVDKTFELFGSGDYYSFDNRQFVFQGNDLYLLLY